jgi:hypothetical protein
MKTGSFARAVGFGQGVAGEVGSVADDLHPRVDQLEARAADRSAQ